MGRYLFALCVAAYFAMPVWAESIGNVSVTAQTCADQCTGIFSAHFLFNPVAYNPDSTAINSFDSLNTGIVDNASVAPLVSGLDVFEYGKLKDEPHHRRHQQSKAMPESGSMGMLLISMTVIAFSFWYSRSRPLIAWQSRCGVSSWHSVF
jgi:hypothetical protein